MKDFIKKIPGIRFIVRMSYYVFIELFNLFPGSEKYWKNRYNLGGTSGDGSYDELAQFKAHHQSFCRKRGYRSNYRVWLWRWKSVKTG